MNRRPRTPAATGSTRARMAAQRQQANESAIGAAPSQAQPPRTAP